MKEDSVTISLFRYHQLKDSEKVAQDSANETIEYRVDKELKKLLKSNILIETESQGPFGMYVKSKHILTDSESVEKIGDKLKMLQAKIDAELDQAKEEKIKYQTAYKKLKEKTWYELLFDL